MNEIVAGFKRDCSPYKLIIKSVSSKVNSRRFFTHCYNNSSVTLKNNSESKTTYFALKPLLALSE